jgi:hypothetical protein
LETFYLSGGSPEFAISSGCDGSGVTLPPSGTLGDVQAWPHWLVHIAAWVTTKVIFYVADKINDAQITTISGAQGAEAAGEAETYVELSGTGIMDFLLGLIPWLELHSSHGATQLW